MDLYFEGLSCRRIAGNMDQFFERETGSTSVYRWVRELTEKADSAVKPMKVATGGVRVADEMDCVPTARPCRGLFQPAR